MSVYARYKKSPEGFRSLVELLETTPTSRRQKMIDIGMEEDPIYTERALALILNFQDIMDLPPLELAELMAEAQPKMTAFALNQASDEVKTRFIKNCKPQIAAQIKDYLTMKIGLREVGGAQLKLIEAARKLEKRGLLKVKRIPA